ncbi:MAG: ATP-binding cassette domain-containing protein, partial [Streptomyces sp.]|nr:ATP-binding cassette domain-containing protein [Streptomyces sp.]
MSDALACAFVSRPGTTAVALDGLGHTYPGALRPVLADLNLSVPVGEHIAVVGRSGCGKSTLLSVIAGLVEPTTGTAAVLDERRPARRLESCALMPQGDSLLPWLSLLDNVAISLRNQRVRRRVARSEAQRMLDRVGLGAWSDARPSALSAGMRQRAALTRALLARKPVLLADEPLGALNAITRAEVQQWLRDTITHT